MNEDLKRRLSKYSKDKLISLLVKAYGRDTETRRDVDKLIQSEKSTDDQVEELKNALEHIDRHPAAFYKDMLEAYAKTEKDKRKRIEAYFMLCDAVVPARSSVSSLPSEPSELSEPSGGVAGGSIKGSRVDHRLIMVASSYYGKAVRMMDEELWAEMKDRAYDLAERFYQIPMDTAFQAVRYYQVMKDKFETPD